MIDNKVSIVLTPEQQAQIHTSLDELLTQLTWTVTLTPEDRKRRLKASSGTEAFLNSALQLGQQHPEILPRGLDIDEMSKDVLTRNYLLGVRAKLAELLTRVEDTMMVCGSEAFQAGLHVYSAARSYGKGMGMDTQMEDLSKRFRRKKVNQAAPV